MTHGLARGGLSVREYGASHSSHSHDYFQVLVGLEGVLELEIEGRGRVVAAGVGALVPPGDRHDFESHGGSRCLVLDTRDELWARCGAAPARPQQAHALAAFLAQALLHDQPLAALNGPALLLESWLPTTPPTRARRAVDWIALAQWTQARLDAPLTVADMAARAYLSSSQFAARCQQDNGMSVMQWLRRQRLVRATQLRDAGLSVTEVAARTGYRSPSALTAALRRSRQR